MWDTWSNMHGVIYSVIFQHIMCTKVGIYFASDVDTIFGIGIGGRFGLGVEDEVVSENGTSVNNDRKGEFDLDIVEISGWGGFLRDDRK